MIHTLRTEPTVRLAVLFGSLARGAETADSDIDILIDAGDGSLANPGRLRARLQDVAGRDVHLVSMETAGGVPVLISDAVDDGRVLVDRKKVWAVWRARAAALRENAAADQRRAEANAREVFDDYARLAR